MKKPTLLSKYIRDIENVIKLAEANLVNDNDALAFQAEARDLLSKAKDRLDYKIHMNEIGMYAQHG